jgi:hypothetical protein
MIVLHYLIIKAALSAGFWLKTRQHGDCLNYESR